MNEGTSDTVPLVSAWLLSRDSKRLLFRKEDLVGQGCRCNFGGAQANWIGDNSQEAPGRRGLCFA
jgi:hypothetical protein